MTLAEWSDPDRRAAALDRVALRVAQYDTPSHLWRSTLAVLRCYAAGMEWMETAATLGISPETVRTHLREARLRLRAKNTTHAVAEAIRAGLLD